MASQYRIKLTYRDRANVKEVVADTVGLAIIKAAEGEAKPTYISAEVLYKPPRKQPMWIVCHVDQAILHLIPDTFLGLEDLSEAAKRDIELARGMRAARLVKQGG